MEPDAGFSTPRFVELVLGAAGKASSPGRTDRCYLFKQGHVITQSSWDRLRKHAASLPAKFSVTHILLGQGCVFPFHLVLMQILPILVTSSNATYQEREGKKGCSRTPQVACFQIISYMVWLR